MDADDDAEEYWNYDTQTLGENDTPAFVQEIIDNTIDGSTCERVAIVNHSYATAETLSYFSSAIDGDRFVSQVINLAPCAIPTYQLGGVVVDEEERRVLSEADASDEIRNLHAIVEADIKEGRELGHSWYLSESYWARTENYCNHYPASCRKYCDYYPYYCDQFCERFPQYCVPDDIEHYYNFLHLVKSKGIYSFYGPNWEHQVDMVCDWVGHWSSTCLSLKSSIDKGYAEMSCKQLEHMWQNDYNEEFATYNENFLEDGWIIDASTLAVDVSGINVDVRNAYTSVDLTCDPEVNQGVLNNVTPFYTEFIDDSITHSNVNSANDNSNLLTYLNTVLSTSANSENTTCGDSDDRM